MNEGQIERRLTAVLAADVAGFARLMEGDEEGTLRALASCREIIGKIVSEFGGHVFAEAGDGCLAEFASVVQAVRAAVRIQEDVEATNRQEPEAARLHLRIGVDLADAMVEGGSLFGEGINLATRLEALAEPGGICISGTVYSQVRHKLPLGFEFTGHHKLKNIAEPVPVYRINRDGADHNPIRKRLASRLRRGRRAPAVAALLALALAAAIYRLAEVSPPAERNNQEPSIAVMPFLDLSSESNQEYFSDGIAEELLNRLAKIDGLKVAARRGSFGFKGREPTVQEIGETLNVATILEGSVRRKGGAIQVTVQLVDTRNGFNIWAEAFERPLADILVIENEIAARIATSLLGAVPERQPPNYSQQVTVNPEAYRLYLKGRYLYSQGSLETLKQANEYYRQAIALDPQFADAYGALARSHSVLTAEKGPEAEEYHRQQSRQAARRALALDPENVQALLVLADRIYFRSEWNFALADETYRRAIAIAPGDWAAHEWYGIFLYRTGQPIKALEQFRIARELLPFYPISIYRIAKTLALLGRSDEALAVAQPAYDSEPGDGLYWGALFYARLATRDLEGARRLFDEPRDPLLGSFMYDTAALFLAHVDGDKAALQALLPAFGDPSLMKLHPSWLAALYLALGDEAAARPLARKADEVHDRYLLEVVRTPAQLAAMPGLRTYAIDFSPVVDDMPNLVAGYRTLGVDLKAEFSRDATSRR